MLELTESITTQVFKRSQGVAAAALIFFAITVVARFPGEMNPDSVDQYQQAVSGRYTDWHPPVMARLWAVLRFFADGPWTLYVLHTGVYWLAFGIIAAALMKAGRPALAWCALLTGAFPPFLMIAINVHKDVGLAAVLLLAFALIFRCRLPGKPVGTATQMSVALLICYGVLVRSNGGFAAVPLIMYAFAPFLLHRPVSAVALCLFAGLALVPATGWMNIHVLHAERRAAIRSLQLFDVTGIAAHTDDPDLFKTIGLDKDQVRNCYTPIFADTVYYDARCSSVWRRLAVLPGAPIGDEAEIYHNPQVTSVWLNAIARHPIAYLEHRFRHFNSTLYFVVPAHHADVKVVKFLRRSEPLVSTTPTLGRSVLDTLRNGFWGTPAFWLAASLTILALGWSRKRLPDPVMNTASLALALSATIYSGAYLFIGVASDARYQFWSMLSTALATVLLGPSLASEWRKRGASRLVWPAAFMAIVVATIVAARFTLQDPTLLTDPSFAAAAGTQGW